MTPMTPTVSLALFAGILSFLSPCVLPLVPSYLAYIGGHSATQPHNRLLTLRNSLLFILGFSLIFIALGASASLLGSVLNNYRQVLVTAGGILVIAFGFVMLGVIRLPALYKDTRQHYQGDSSTPIGAVLLGMAFAAGWTPCIGPVLGAILTMAASSGTLTQGAILLSFYALGLAIPFFIAAIALESFVRFSARFKRFLPWVERVAGGILIVAGVLMVTGTMTQFNRYLLQFTPEWLFSKL